MRNIIISALALTSIIPANAKEKYEATWESLGQRECPTWFPDAKFGIFIHWGLYSVPSYTSKGTYAEWYWHALQENPATASPSRLERHLAISKFHNQNYGEDFPYESFAEEFTCELFDPQEWAQLFKDAGAKYVVLTSKHHDGYCLWDNKEASESFGHPWNSVEVGPNRDLVGDLTEAVRDEGIKMGLYYSIWDWYNPYWDAKMQECVSSGNMDVNFKAKSNKKSKFTPEQINESKEGLNKYVHNVMYPQFKELVNKYQPSLIFSDGDWWMNDELWQSKPLLAWLYNEAPNREEVVINDRWGRVRGKQGDYYTTEYGSGFEGIDKPWEENRGLGMSFGYNRIENINDYRTEKELIYMLADLVSRGGNLLLNIGPRADGSIPVIMQERLTQIGDWLKVNGEAIYETRAYKNSAQWSEGNRPTFTKSEFHNGFPIFEMTSDPKPGNAVKEIWFTKKPETLFAMTPGFPKEQVLIVKDIESIGVPKVSLLGVDGLLPSFYADNTLKIDLSGVDRANLPCNYVYSFKIENVK